MLVAHSTPTYPEIQVVFDIPEKAAYHCSKVDDMGGLYLLEQSLSLCCIPEGSQDVRGHRRPQKIRSWEPGQWV